MKRGGPTELLRARMIADHSRSAEIELSERPTDLLWPTTPVPEFRLTTLRGRVLPADRVAGAPGPAHCAGGRDDLPGARAVGRLARRDVRDGGGVLAPGRR